MEFGTGAMSSLLSKLGGLLLEEYKLKDSVKNGIRELKAELESMEAALVKVSSVPLDQLDPQVKIWANEVRELTYAMEDSIDSFVTRAEGVEPTKPKIKHLLKMVRNECTKFKARHEIANDIRDIENQVRKIKERYDRYKFEYVVANPVTTTIDPRLSALYNKVTDLVGIGKPIHELMEVLSMSEENLKIVSIVGLGGLGKTTLAKALYDKLKKIYEYRGFVPVGQNPDTRKVLSDILLELDMELYRAAVTMDERQLINQLQKFLAGKRYIVVIDDIWSTQIWETIKHAFVDSHPESKIIITTRIVDVAAKAGGIYHMEPLSYDNSKMLFYRRIRCEGVREDNQPSEVTTRILKKCGGVPLAIITIASLLVGKRSEDWSKVYDAIGFGHEDNEVVHNTRNILSFSYYDLPSNLKTCLLYLSMFPEDSFIEKKSLIWRWVSEGLVPDREGIGSIELGEVYFNMLVNKSMIRWIEPDELVKVVGGCRVHDMVLDLIRTISNDVNFVKVHDMEPRDTCSRGKQINRVRRLALHGGSVEHSSINAVEHSRSFSAIGCGDNMMPLLSSFKVLRVLVIKNCVFPEGHNLEHLRKLVKLRYLGLVNTTTKLPEGIGNDLKVLEILDVRGGSISELPPSVGELRNLRCLWADEGTRMKAEIGKLTCLEELQLHLVNMCPIFFTGVGKLTELKVLELLVEEIEETAGKALVLSLCNLRKIHSVKIWYSSKVRPSSRFPHVLCGSLEDLVPSSKLQSLSLYSITIPRMPSWISHLRVPLLSHLFLHVKMVEAWELQTLGMLPSLLYLVLRSKEEKCISYTFGSYEFHKLRWLGTNIEITLGEGALPRLTWLSYSASAGSNDAARLVPWNNRCPLLDFFTCRLDCANSGSEEVKAVKVTMTDAAKTHPNNPRFRIVRKNYDWDAGEFAHELESMLCCLDRPVEVDQLAEKEADMRNMIVALEALLQLAEPRVGRYTEQELRGFVTKLKSWLRDDAGAHTRKGHDGHDTGSGDHLEVGSQP